MIQREITSKLLSLAGQYPVVTMTGPRQSGKTTLCRAVFPEKKYYSLEDPNTRRFALEDPKAFLESCLEKGAVIDEFQRAPELPSYIQGLVDGDRRPGRFILTGSQNFQLMNQVSQSLAGRTALLTLLPLSYTELYKRRRVEVSEILHAGFYPRIFDRKLDPSEVLSFYVSTYIERDVRTLLNVRDLRAFEVFLRLCAARSGQLTNASALANECGINHNTARQWLTVLEASHILFFLPPHFRNFSKRLTKSAKLYFVDVGLASFLLAIGERRQLDRHPLKGPLFETFVVSEMLKRRTNQGKSSNLYFFRDHVGNEVDVLIDQGDTQLPVEIKLGQTVQSDFFKGIDYYYNLNETSRAKGFLVYGGMEAQKRSHYQVLPYHDLSALPL
ncbi:MAG: ATP-binding protein [Acidobacteria bacterium]|jgi:hypothetical protein|nr:ATP-binding protein [Acidobacteriota bacterium]